MTFIKTVLAVAMIAAQASASAVSSKSCHGKKDHHRSCAHWARIGECAKNPGYMLNKCAKSCHGKNFAVATKKKFNKHGDNHQYCASWAKRGECKKNPNYMLKMCAKSCNGKKER